MTNDLPIANRLNILIGNWMKRMKDLGELQDYIKSDAGFWIFDCQDIVPELEKELLKVRKEEKGHFLNQLKERKYMIEQNGMAEEFLQELINDYEEELDDSN